jgi:hypothetical protein
MSYYAMTDDMYRPPYPANPDWASAPVPGWGTNPYRAGPARVGVGRNSCVACGAADASSEGLIGLLVAGTAIVVLVVMAAVKT